MTIKQLAARIAALEAELLIAKAKIAELEGRTFPFMPPLFCDPTPPHELNRWWMPPEITCGQSLTGGTWPYA